MEKWPVLVGSLILAAMLLPCTAFADDDGRAYDEQLALALGADDYGMRRYVMAVLKAGPNQGGDAEEVAEIQRGHMAHIRQMVADGKMVLAGPFLGGGEMRGIFVFAVDSVDQARELTEADPAVQAGRLVMELHPWYGSAALIQVSEIHDRIARQNP
jgi:uncharacterized protein